MTPRIITLTTDFGLRDHFVGVMKGVILGIHPEARIVDITHELPPQDLMAAAFITHASYRYFPKGTIHLVVVDPGVGSDRRPIILSIDQQTFVGPDNGVFTLIRRFHPESRIRQVTAGHYFLKGEGGRTFQGRDLFAPVAAWIARGAETYNLGDEVSEMVSLPIPEPTLRGELLAGEVIHQDRFGNLITNIPGGMVDDFLRKRGKGPEEAKLRIGETRIEGLRSFYAETPAGTVAFLINSSDLLEIYAYSGSASELLHLFRGAKVELH